jgi:hypothetical protein
MASLSPDPHSIHDPAHNDRAEAYQTQPFELLYFGKRNSGASSADLKYVDYRGFNAGEAGPLVHRDECLRQLLSGKVIDPYSEAGDCKK